MLGIQLLLQLAGDLDIDQAVVTEIEHGAIGAIEIDMPVVGDDQPVVGDLPTEQADRAAAGGVDQPIVDDARHRAMRIQIETPGHEIGGRHVQRAGQQAADIELGRWPENDAVGVDQEDKAVRVDVTENQTRVLIEDAVQRDRSRRGLVEQHGRVGTDIEGIPVDRQ
nr:hypothetical protein [Metallibacterium sp.]